LAERIDEPKYKLPLTHEQQIDLLGELMSARARIKMLKASIAMITNVVQDVMEELRVMQERERNRLDSRLILSRHDKT